MFSAYHRMIYTCLMLGGLSSCSVQSNTLTGNSQSGTNDRIVLVTTNPSSAGHRRLVALSRDYSVLDSFIKNKGYPRYLAETNNSRNRYLIMYYPAQMKAYVCRGGLGRSSHAEFIGPFPIKDSEMAKLRRLDNGTDQFLR